MRITRVAAARHRLPLRTPFTVSKRTAYHAETILVAVHTDGPARGCGASAAATYVTGETLDSMQESVDAAAPELAGLAVDDIDALLATAGSAIPDKPSARAGVEMALFDVWAKARGVRLWNHFGAAERRLETDLTIPIVAPDEARDRVREASARGYRAFKIKVGSREGVDADLALLAAVGGAAPNATLRVDANQAFSPETALAFLERAGSLADRIELFEQPVDRDDIDGLARVAAAARVPVYADEAVCTPEQARAVIRAKAADGVNIKLMKSGIAGALRIVSLCREAGLDLMIGCMLESPIGIAASAQIAAGLGGFRLIDLDAHELLLPVEGVAGGISCEGSELLVPAEGEPGWGARIDETIGVS